MRRCLIFSLLLCMVLFCACGAVTSEQTADVPEEAVSAEEAAAEAEGTGAVAEQESNPILFAVYAFAHDGIVLAPGDLYSASLFEDTEDAVTTPDCRTGSDATTYTYDGFTVSTVRLQDLETGIYKQPYISSIELSGAGVATQEGISVGSTEDNVLAVYGTDYAEEFGGWVYHSAGDTTLTVYFDETGSVSFIVYALDSSLFDSAAVPEAAEQEPFPYSENPDSGIVFSGLDTFYIDYYAFYEDPDLSTIDFLDGVTAVDRSGNELALSCECYCPTLIAEHYFGPGYAVISATDASGNTNTALRPFFIETFGENEQNVIKTLAEQIGSDDPVAVKQYVLNAFYYAETYQMPSPVTQGYYKGYGNCYVHARLLQEVLRYDGYDTMMCWSTDSRHFWVLVYVQDAETGAYVWRHLDATPLQEYQTMYTGLMTDEERIAMLNGHSLDTAFWPDAD